MLVSRRRGFTLIELLVVIAIIAVLVSLLLPAVQTAREAARRTSCRNNVKQMLLAFHNYADVHKGFPNRYSLNGTTLNSGHGWGFKLLPFMDQEPLYNAWNMSKSFFDPENSTVTMTPVASYLCPSSLGTRSMDVSSGTTTTSTGMVSDYVVFHQITATGSGATCSPCNTAAPKTAGTVTPFTAISDGMSSTILLSEQAGRPFYCIGPTRQATTTGLTNPKFWGSWASYQSVTGQGWNDAATPAAGASHSMNWSNSQGVYSFHGGGAVFGLCDGSVRFINQSVPLATLVALWTRDDGDLIRGEF